jgi:hypothetical protein
MVPSESAPQELSNEWSCQYVSTILSFLAGAISVTEITINSLEGEYFPSIAFGGYFMYI